MQSARQLQIDDISSELVAMAPVGILYLDRNGEVLYMNPKLKGMIGIADSYGGLCAEDFMKNLLAQPSSDGRPSLLGSSLRGQAASVEELEYISSSGTVKWMNIYSTPTLDSAGRLDGAVVVCVNVSGSKELREQLIQAQKMEAVGQLASGVAHDFNNLLTVINGHTDLLQMHLGEEDELQEHVREIEKAADSAAKLVLQLMEFSRKRPISQSVMDVNNTIKQMKGMIIRLLTENIVLETYLDPLTSSILANGGQLEQVIVNLAVNAQHAMPRGGKLIIETMNAVLDEHYCANQTDLTPGNYVLLAISDTGTGMTEDVKQKIFDPFFTTKLPGKGTGLGLSTVYGIVKQNHGHIVVYSELDRGTSFHIYLPAQAHKLTQSDDFLSNYPPRGGDETILLVEDEDSVRTTAIRILEDLGYRVFSARDGNQAMEMFRTYAQDLDMMITDLGIPHSTGGEIGRAMQDIKPDLKVLYMSGYTSNVAKENGLIEDESRFIQKPLQYKELANEIREALDTSEPMDSSLYHLPNNPPR